MKIVVSGGREFKDYQFVKLNLLKLLENFDLRQIEIVAGGQTGVDTLAEMFADEFGCKKHIIQADWNRLGRAAGPIRNREMAVYAAKEHCVCFWDGKSPGTKNMIETAKKHKLETVVIRYDSQNKKDQ